MPIKFRCEHCRQLLGISQTKAGKIVDCPTCGRAVRVPSLDGKADPISIPKWDPQDSSLVNALSALASLTEDGGRGGAGSVAAEAAGVEEGSFSDEDTPVSDKPVKLAAAPVVTAIPEPIEMPPLETPVLLPEPGLSPRPSSKVDPDAAREPWAKLAELSDAAPSQDTRPGGRNAGTSAVPFQPSVRGVTLPIALLLVVMAFLLGYFVGQARNSSPAQGSSGITETNDRQESKPDAAGQEAPATESITRRRAVAGRVTYLSDAGSSQPDTGAVVILLPAYRNSSTKLPIVGCRPADSSEDREVAKAMVKALGGDLAVVDEQGFYSCDLPQAGEYHLIILSRHLERAEDEPLAAATRTMLSEYFDRPQQIVGKLKFHVSEVNYRGETAEIHDHTFGRES